MIHFDAQFPFHFSYFSPLQWLRSMIVLRIRTEFLKFEYIADRNFLLGLFCAFSESYSYTQTTFLLDSSVVPFVCSGMTSHSHAYILVSPSLQIVVHDRPIVLYASPFIFRSFFIIIFIHHSSEILFRMCSMFENFSSHHFMHPMRATHTFTQKRSLAPASFHSYGMVRHLQLKLETRKTKNRTKEKHDGVAVKLFFYHSALNRSTFTNI